jgi:hypothetical protein
VNKFVRTLACLSVAALISAVPASAQNVSFGYQFQHLSNGGDGFNMPLGLNVDAAVPVGSRLSIVGQVDWSRKSESETFVGTSVEATLSATTYGGGVRWTGRAPSVAPYIDVLFGATHFSGNGNVAGVEVLSDSSTDAMFQVGGGVAVPLDGATSVIGQFDYRRIFTDDEGTNSIRFVAGIRFGFGH